MKDFITKYLLENDTTVEVHKVFGDKYYIAIVDMDGRYPKKGKIAHDIERSEYLYVVDGVVTLFLNGEKYSLKKGDNMLIKDGDYYSLEGVCRAIVFVHDEEGGASQIEDEK